MPAISLLDCVLPLVAALSEDWVYKFLLEHTPESDLEFLTSHTNLERAFAGVNLYDAVNNSMFCVPKAIVELFNTNWVFVPVRCTGRYSASLVIKENVARPGFLKWPGEKAVGSLANLTSVLHAVQDIYTGQLCLVAMGKKGMTHCMVVFSTHTPDAGKYKHRAFFAIPGDALRKRQLAPIAASVRFLMRVNERTNCPACKYVCHCRTSLIQFQADAQVSLLSNAGSFDASSSVLVINNGSVISSTPSVAFRSKMHTVDSPELIVRLLKWAISNTLASVLDQASIADKPCPTQLVESAYRTMKDVRGMFHITSNRQPAISTRTPTAAAQLSNTVTCNTSGPPSNVIAPFQQALLPFPSSPFSSLPRLDLHSANEFPLLFDAEQDNEGQLRTDDLFDPVQINLVLDQSPSRETAAGPCDTLGHRSTSTSEGPALLFPEIPEIDSIAYANHYVAQAATTDNGIESPAHNAGSTAPVTVPEPEVQSPQVEAPPLDPNSREARQLRRKIRNRESAARSNRRKQLFLSELKRNIAENKKKADSLRSRLEELQAENEDLKARAAAIDST